MVVGVESENLSASPPKVTGLPRVNAPVGAREEADLDGPESEHNTIFDSLVKVEGEVAGLVAYSIYKQNKKAWLQDFIKASGRPPSEAESRAYIIGESTERRLATYRHLAEATLAGEAPSSAGRPMRREPARPVSFFVVWAIVLVAAIALLAFALLSMGVGK